ncbi:ExbD/TolR family protein [Antarcticimicrobium luteum]|uniref:Biopolymer transporter ExbD n=1 Tax=Antarcticimicrobium luteum TaxID=2547397 RepID=A0A4R5V034_9RHOB|nr:biopolymer transporter ExbD [Antarcticimicrobium luteum]TDK45063.1 biopolymer transporter ExbD [Antarcticimicrobium luteum]
MQIAPPHRSPPRESVVPMINVVFLLLIFFLMTSQIAPPDPVEVTPPVSDQGAPVDHGTRLFVGPDGIPQLDGLYGEAALAALARRDTDAGPVILAADAGVPAARVARLMRRLAGLGVTRVELSVLPR